MKLLIWICAEVAYCTLYLDGSSCVLPEMHLWKVLVEPKTFDGRIHSTFDVVLECMINNLFKN